MQLGQPSLVLVRDHRRPIGGLETWTENLANGLADASKNVIVLEIVPPGTEQIERPNKENIASRRIEASSDSVEQARIVLKELFRLSDLGYFGAFAALSYDYVNIAALNIHGSAWKPLAVMHGPYLNALDWFYSMPEAHLVVPSRHLYAKCRAEISQRFGAYRSSRRIHLIPHGVPFTVERAAGRITKCDGKNGNLLQIFAATRLDADTKRPFDYLEVADRLRQLGVSFKMRIAGAGPALEEVIEQHSKLGLHSQVELLGALERAEVADYMRESDVFLSTSSEEAFGLSVVEAMIQGCPVVAAQAPGQIEELGRLGLIHTCSVGDLGSISRRIQKLSLNREMRERGAEIAQKYAVREFSVEKMTSQYVAVVKRISALPRATSVVRPSDLILKSPLEVPARGRLRNIRLPEPIKNLLRTINSALGSWRI